jgi:hypothetical protein
MQVRVEQIDCTEFETPLLAVKIFEGESELVGPVAKVDERIGGRIADVIRRGDFRGARGRRCSSTRRGGGSPRSAYSWSGSASERSWTWSGSGGPPRPPRGRRGATVSPALPR